MEVNGVTDIPVSPETFEPPVREEIPEPEFPSVETEYRETEQIEEEHQVDEYA
jgi:hypothetical protein